MKVNNAYLHTHTYACVDISHVLYVCIVNKMNSLTCAEETFNLEAQARRV